MIARCALVALSLAALASLGAACSRPSCLDGDCEATAPCAALGFVCETPLLVAGTLAEAPAALRVSRGQGGAGDFFLSNGVVTAVVSALDAPTDLAPTGGNLIDLGPAGGVDDLTILYQLAGLLPDDAFAYDRVELVDRSPAYVALVVRGHLDGRPDVLVATRYELRPCDPGLRVRSELFNGSPDLQAFVIADVTHWGKRRVLPFAPAKGQGYATPALELLELTSLWRPLSYVAAAAPSADGPGYGFVACDRNQLHGVNDLEVSALGTDLETVHPGEGLVFERFIASAGDGTGGGGVRGGSGPAAVVSALLAARTAQRGAARPSTITGRVLAEGFGFGGDVRRASIVITAREDATPVTAVVPAADGTFTATVPRGDGYLWEVWSFGVRVLRGVVPDDGGLGDLTVPAPATVQLHVTGDDAPIHALVVVEPADPPTRDAVEGTFHGRLTRCAPWLGPPDGASPACNRVLVEPAGTDVEIPQGRYWIYASAGPDWSLARQAVDLTDGELTSVELGLRSVALRPPGWLGADLHVHGHASFDSGLPDRDRVRSFVAAGVDVIAATDHDYVTDYAATVDALGVGDRVLVIGGLETTPLIPFLELPGEDLPKVIGHFNFWPLTPVPSSPRGGAPWDERLEPGALFDRLEPLIGADGVTMINHPWDEPSFGRDLGYLRAIGFDPRVKIATDTVNGRLLRSPSGGHRNLDWDVMEVQNGAGADEWVKTRPLWFAMLSAGYPVPGAANSDSHGLRDNQLGWGRTWVDVGRPLADTTTASFDRALKRGRVVAGSGVFVEVAIGPRGAPRRGLGLEPLVPRAGDVVAITVRAAPWIPVTSVRVVTSRGERVLVSDLAQPADPFGTDGVVRWQGEVALADLVAGSDDWIVIEAGLPPPPYADLDDDGVLDTGDNDGDGVVDERDVGDGEDTGPIVNPPDPTDPTDLRYHMTRIVPESWPIGFTSPLLVDVAGDGWDAPNSAP